VKRRQSPLRLHFGPDWLGVEKPDPPSAVILRLKVGCPKIDAPKGGCLAFPLRNFSHSAPRPGTYGLIAISPLLCALWHLVIVRGLAWWRVWPTTAGLKLSGIFSGRLKCASMRWPRPAVWTSRLPWNICDVCTKADWFRRNRRAARSLSLRRRGERLS